MSILTQTFMDCSFEQLLSLRSTGRYLFGALAVNMLLQASYICFKLFETLHSSEWSDGAFIALVLCYSLWILISAAGGIFGLYTTHSFHTRSGILCMYAWILLLIFQIFETIIACWIILPEANYSQESAHKIILNTLCLLAIELVFIGFIYGYIQLLQLCEPAKRWISKGEEGICLTNAAESIASPVVSVNVTSYGTDSASFTI